MKVFTFDNILGVLILLSLISVPHQGEAFNVWDMKFFHISIIILFISNLYNRTIRLIENFNYIVALNVIVLISAFMFDFKNQTMIFCLNYFFASIGIVIITRNCDKPENIYKWFIAAIIINMFVLGFQHLGWNPIVKNAPNIPGGLLSNAPRFSAFIGLILPIIFDWNIPFFLVAALYCLYPDINSTTLIIALMIVLFRCKNKYLKWVIIVICLIGFGLCYDHILNSFRVRFTMIYNIIIKNYFETPLLGYGVGASMGNPDIQADNQMQSSFLQFIYGTGIAGIIYIIYIIKLYLDNYKRTTISLCILSLLFLCVFEYPLEIKRLWLTIITLISFYIIENQQFFKDKLIKSLYVQ